MVILVYALTSNAKEAEVEWFYKLTRPSRTNIQEMSFSLLSMSYLARILVWAAIAFSRRSSQPRD